VAADGTALREAIRTSMAGLASGNVALSEALQSSISQVAAKLDGHAQVTTDLLLKVDQHTERFGQGSTGIMQALEGYSERMDAVNGRFDAVASASQGLTRQLEAVVASNMQLIDGSRKRLEGFERAAAHSEKIVVSLAEIHPLLSRHVEALKPPSTPTADRGGISVSAPPHAHLPSKMASTAVIMTGNAEEASSSTPTVVAEAWAVPAAALQRPSADA